MYLHIELYVVFHCELPGRPRGRFCVGLVLYQRGRRWADIFHPLGRRYYFLPNVFCHLRGDEHERWVDAGLMLSHSLRLWTDIELVLARRLLSLKCRHI